MILKDLAKTCVSSVPMWWLCSIEHNTKSPESRFFPSGGGYKSARKEGNMGRLQSFQVVAWQRGFSQINEAGGGTVLWLGRKAPDTVRETHQRICIDSLTKSATVYWMTVPGDLKSKTFRDAPALQEWFELRLEMTAPR